ncbi:DUF3806 domain-containing protein [Luteolibacter flavescens]|uniref:DUF3806 domain-containing protein n=1 Tax=Luteolibacter flavescens TaxID=1859460 RepID=A0ABT3FNJ1_9BACT|nr:DUF3806 domain-containing protein [Luteolibacter flavescens]MCW1884560.1 DUF3806 domain-containing protein [Luteolibacter flavescens]
MPKTKTRLPNPEEQATLRDAVAWVNNLLAEEYQTDVRLTGTMEDIPNLHTMLGEGPFTDDPEAELKTFGIVFGNVLARELGLRWVIHRDDEGTNYALQYQDTELLVFPCEVISARLEEGEEIDEINLEAILESLRESLAGEAANKKRRD